MINIDFLNYLIEYSKTENLSKASKNLHLSQSALTRAMQKVEEYVGVPIFVRSKNKLTLTDTGRELTKYAKMVVDDIEQMKKRTIDFYNSHTNISIGIVAPGPMLKYGNLLYSIFPNKTITSKIVSHDELVEGLISGMYDFIFTTTPVNFEGLSIKFAFKEKLYVSVPKNHFISGMKNGVHFSEIDGQSFLVADNLGIWDDIIEKYLPKSKFLKQTMDNLYEIVNASTIPSFVTNISYLMRNENDRVAIPLLDDVAQVEFFLVYKNENKQMLNNLLKII